MTMIRPSMNSVKMTYALVPDPQYEKLMTATSHLTATELTALLICHLQFAPKHRFAERVEDAAFDRAKNGFLFPALCRHGRS